MKAFRVKLKTTWSTGSGWSYVTYSNGLSPIQDRGKIMNSSQQVKACLRKWAEYESVVELLETNELGEMSSDTFKADF